MVLKPGWLAVASAIFAWDWTRKILTWPTSARPEQVQQIFSRHYATGLQHGTVTVIWRELAVEITTFRTEGTYTDSRRPDLVIFHDQIDAGPGPPRFYDEQHGLAAGPGTIGSAWRPLMT